LKLDTLYNEMLSIMGPYIDLGRAIGGLGAILFISTRVWGHIARNEAVDVFPLLRPFAIGLCILLFPQLCSTLRGVTSIVSHSADASRIAQQQQVAALSKQRDDAARIALKNKSNYQPDKSSDDELASITGPSLGGMAMDAMGIDMDAIKFEAGRQFREWVKNLLELGAVGAQLALSLVSTFLLIMLSVIGPLAFGIAILPGFGGGIQKWFGNFITISLWVPVAAIYGTILAHLQVDLLKNDLIQIQSSGSTEASDIGYLCFLLLSIIGYMFVPKATELIVDHSGVGTAASSAMQTVATAGAGYAGAAAGVGGRGAMGLTQGVFGQTPGSGNPNATVSPAQAFGHRVGSAINKRFNS
jgi:conjugative transposon TraJ protein